MIRFNGQEFATMAAFGRAFPVYREYGNAVRDGADTVEKLERVIAERKAASRKGQRAGRETWAKLTVKEARDAR